MSTKERFDVVIFEVTTRKVTNMAGTNLPETGSFHTVSKRMETVQERINDHYGVLAVPAGTVEVGDTIPE